MARLIVAMILNVDDDDGARYARTRTLQLAGLSVIEAATGEAALQQVSEQQPALVLLDVGLPDMDGFEVCRTIKAHFPDILIVQVSASFTSEAYQERGLSGGADSFLVAPIDPGILIATVRALLRLHNTISALAQHRASLEAAQRELAERKKAEATLLLHDRALAATAHGVIITDASQAGNPIIYVNLAFERLTGYPAEETIGRSCSFLQGSGSELSVIIQMREAIAAGRTFQGAITNYRKDGTAFTNEINISPVHDDTGTLTHFVGTQADITARRRLEEQLRQSQKMEAVGQLTGGIAHDFNNLLTVILGNTEILADEIEDPGLQRLAKITEETASRAAELTGKLLAFGRRQTLKPEPIALDELVLGMVGLLNRTLGEHVEIKLAIEQSQSAALTDRSLFESAILNLAVNARDAMPKGGTLTISTGERVAGGTDGALPIGQPVVFITVSDTGTGMSLDVLAHVFEPFFTTKEVGKGSGLGLAMVYGFAQQSGGHVSIESREGEGTSVTIVLRAVGKEAAQEPDDNHTVPTRGGERVLVVEDEPSVRQFVDGQLTNLGYEVTSVATASEAVALLERGERFDLLFTDVVLPQGISGVELSRLAVARCPELKVLLTSGYSEEIFQQHGRPEEGTLLLRKPYRRKELAVILRKVLDG